VTSKFKRIALTTAVVTGLTATPKFIDKVHAEPLLQVFTSCYVVECNSPNPHSCSMRKISEDSKESEMSRIRSMKQTKPTMKAAVQCYREERRRGTLTDQRLTFEIPETRLQEEPIKSFLEKQENMGAILALLCGIGILSPIAIGGCIGAFLDKRKTKRLP
jgi:hypothetical protein